MSLGQYAQSSTAVVLAGSKPACPEDGVQQLAEAPRDSHCYQSSAFPFAAVAVGARARSSALLARGELMPVMKKLRNRWHTSPVQELPHPSSNKTYDNSLLGQPPTPQK
eukprot:747620-Amphidinium_carterae.1